MLSVCALRTSRLKTMEQAAVNDVGQLVDTMVINREVSQLGGLGNVRINEIELAVCLRNYVVRQSHRRGW